MAIDPAAKFKMRVERQISTRAKATAAYTMPLLMPLSV